MYVEFQPEIFGLRLSLILPKDPQKKQLKRTLRHQIWKKKRKNQPNILNYKHMDGISFKLLLSLNLKGKEFNKTHLQFP